MAFTLAHNNYASQQVGLDDPAIDGEEVTPGAPFTKGVCRSLYVGTGGSVVVRMKEGTDLPFANVADGTVLRVMATQVVASGTTASDILALH